MKLKRISRTISLGLAALALLALLAAACGGDDDAASKTTSAGGTTASGATTKSGDSNSKTPEANSTGNVTGNGVKDLQDAAKNFKSSNFKITYDVTSTDADGKETTGTMVMAQKGSSSYFAAENFLEQDGTAILIDDGKNSYICTDTPSKTCLKTASTGGESGAISAFKPDEILSSFDEDGAKVDKAPDQTIAGHSAKCYKATDSGGTGTICLDKKTNLILLVDGSDGDNGTMKLKAKTVSDSPSDNDFKPPYAVQSIPGQ